MKFQWMDVKEDINGRKYVEMNWEIKYLKPKTRQLKIDDSKIAWWDILKEYATNADGVPMGRSGLYWMLDSISKSDPSQFAKSTAYEPRVYNQLSFWKWPWAWSSPVYGSAKWTYRQNNNIWYKANPKSSNSFEKPVQPVANIDNIKPAIDTTDYSQYQSKNIATQSNNTPININTVSKDDTYREAPIIWNIRNVVGWALNSATEAPALLWKWVWRVVNETAKQFWANPEKSDKIYKSRVDHLDNERSNLVWEDTSSWLYKWTNALTDVAQLWVPIAKWATKVKTAYNASKYVEPVVKNTASWMKAAAKELAKLQQAQKAAASAAAKAEKAKQIQEKINQLKWIAPQTKVDRAKSFFKNLFN